MLIVATQDPTIRQYCQRPESKAAAWGAIYPIDAGLDQNEADAQLVKYLGGLTTGENLCVVAHGNDSEIGDHDTGGRHWGWTYKRLARLLATAVQVRPGTILIEACADTVTNFPVKMAVRLSDSWQGINHLDGITVYGYNVGVGSTRPIPRPDQLATNVEAQPVIITV